MMTMIALRMPTQWLALLKVLYIQKLRQNSRHRSKTGTNHVRFSEENWRRLTGLKNKLRFTPPPVGEGGLLIIPISSTSNSMVLIIVLFSVSTENSSQV